MLRQRALRALAAGTVSFFVIVNAIVKLLHSLTSLREEEEQLPRSGSFLS